MDFIFYFKLKICPRRDIDTPSCILFALVVFPPTSTIRDNMAAALRGSAWKDDCNFKNVLDDLVKKGYKRDEIILLLEKTFLNIHWVV